MTKKLFSIIYFFSIIANFQSVHAYEGQPKDIYVKELKMILTLPEVSNQLLVDSCTEPSTLSAMLGGNAWADGLENKNMHLQINNVEFKLSKIQFNSDICGENGGYPIRFIFKAPDDSYITINFGASHSIYINPKVLNRY